MTIHASINTHCYAQWKRLSLHTQGTWFHDLQKVAASTGHSTQT